MHSTLLPPPTWAQLEFGTAALGDHRRTARLVRVAEGLVQSPTGTLPQAFPRWADLKAAYRFFDNPHINSQNILAPHREGTRQSCQEPGEYLLIEDTTELDYSTHRKCSGLGQIGNEYGRGLHLHTSLAVRVEAWDLDHRPEVTVTGVLGQRCWARPQAPGRSKSKENWRQRLGRERESQRWAESLECSPARPAEVSWIYLADRESDIYEAMERCLEQEVDFVIRAKNNRTLVQEDQRLFEAVAGAAVLGEFEQEVRGRKGRKARLAKLEVRAVSVTLKGAWRPEGPRPDLEVRIVEAREIDPPEGEDPIVWKLLTSLPVKNFVQGRRIVARYAKRWIIEEFHKALKSGANVEKSELEEAQNLKPLVAVLSVIAVRLLNTKMLARTHPNQPVQVEAFGHEPLQILSAHFGEPAGGWRYGTLFISIARMGGFLARRGDGNPGWITIWRGWRRLMTMAEGVTMMNQNSR